MSGRLVRRVLKEQEALAPTLERDLAAASDEDEEEDAPAPSRNPFDLLDDQ